MTSRFDLDLVLANTGRFYSLTFHGLPVLRPNVKACGCGSEQWVPRGWRWHQRSHSTTSPYRCDVAVKCTGCAVLLGHGVVLPEAWWDLRPIDLVEDTKRLAYHDLPEEYRGAVDAAARGVGGP